MFLSVEDVKLLPSNPTKHGLWRRYADICASMGQVPNFVTYGTSSAHLSWLCNQLLIYVGRARETAIRFSGLQIYPKRKKQKPELSRNIFASPLESENIIRGVARNPNITFKLFLKLTLTKHAHLAHSMELYITPTITRNSFITPQNPTSQDQFTSTHLENVGSLAFVAKQFLAK